MRQPNSMHKLLGHATDCRKWKHRLHLTTRVSRRYTRPPPPGPSAHHVRLGFPAMKVP